MHPCDPSGMIRSVTRRRNPKGSLLATDDPDELPPPRFGAGADVGWAVAELFEAAWIAAGRDPREFDRSPRERRETRTR